MKSNSILVMTTIVLLLNRVPSSATIINAAGLSLSAVSAAVASAPLGDDRANSETDTSLDFAHDCDYLPKDDHAALVEKRREIGAMLGSMISNPSSFIAEVNR